MQKKRNTKMLRGDVVSAEYTRNKNNKDQWDVKIIYKGLYTKTK